MEILHNNAAQMVFDFWYFLSYPGYAALVETVNRHNDQNNTLDLLRS